MALPIWRSILWTLIYLQLTRLGACGKPMVNLWYLHGCRYTLVQDAIFTLLTWLLLPSLFVEQHANSTPRLTIIEVCIIAISSISLAVSSFELH